MTDFDILIAGGGMVGATLAYAIGQQTPFRVGVIEAVEPQKDTQPSFDGRALALAHETVQGFEALGLWREMCPFAEAIHTIHISDRGFSGKAQMQASDFGVDALGYVAEVRNIGNLLIDKLAQCENISWLTPQSVTAISQSQQEVEVGLSTGAPVSAKLLVGCDGGNSQVRQLLKATTQVDDYQQVAVIATVQTSEPHQHRAFERFTQHGPIALLPLTDNRLSLVWCLPPKEAEQVLKLGESEFCHALQQAFGYKLGRFERAAGIASYPLKRVYTEDCLNHRCVLLGNACHTVHPIAGQGFNLGMRDVLELAQALTQVQDPGDFSALHQYRARRQQDQRRILGLTDLLVRSFSNTHVPMVAGRNLGLKAMNFLPQLATPLAHITLGRQ